MVDAATAAVAVEAYKDGRGAINSIVQNISYVKDLGNNYRKMTEEAKKLYARRDDIQAKVNKDKTKRTTKECEAWICRVKKIEEVVLELETKYIKEKKSLNYLLRNKLSKCMVEKCEELRVLWAEGKFELGVVAEDLPEPVIIINAPKIDDMPSLQSLVEEVLGFLADNSVRRIGLWGTVGVGKTAIMQNLNDNANIAKMFDIIIWVTVSKDCSVEKLQNTIVKRLKLNMQGITGLEETAWRISKELECRRYLLLLDEVWDSLDLHAVGIRNNNMHSKVVLATRIRDICYDMEADEQINVKRLSGTEALKLFREKVGRSIKNIPDVEPVVQLVVKECVGLPLLIDKVARTFRKKENIHLWRDGLRSLRRWPSIKSQGLDEVLDFLKFCYTDLDGEDKKVWFLYGALYPEDCDLYVDYLLECWRAEGFIHDACEFRDARDKGHTILDDLIKVSLLEKCQKMKHVRMNKVLRTMALKIASQNPDSKFLVRTREELCEPPNEEEWEKANRISLMDNKLCTLPKSPDCNNLSTLLLQRNSDLTAIPKPFFVSMQNLRVLDLHGTGITSLPSSLSFLTCLRALYLNSCIQLTELPSYIEELEHLEVLDIRGTGINSLPIQIGRLIRLKCLRMALANFGMGHTYQGQSTGVEISHDVISSLSLLEELTIDLGPYNQWCNETVKALTKAVATLTKLTSLSFCFPDVNCLDIFITGMPKWKDICFQFSVGYHDSTRYKILEDFQYQINKCLKFTNGEGIHHAISDVLAKSQLFELIGHKKASRLSDFGITSMNEMRGCLIEGCNDLKTIIDGNGLTEVALEHLEKMYIKNVIKLGSIWEGPVPVGSLASLTTMIFCNCSNLKKIFSKGMIQQLSKLQHLKVEECPEIEEVIMESQNNGLEGGALPSLKTLTLKELPKLQSIWKDHSLLWPSLVEIRIFECQVLKSFPFNDENATKLILIEGQESWWNSLVWQENAIGQRLRSICIFN